MEWRKGQTLFLGEALHFRPFKDFQRRFFPCECRLHALYFVVVMMSGQAR